MDGERVACVLGKARTLTQLGPESGARALLTYGDGIRASRLSRTNCLTSHHHITPLLTPRLEKVRPCSHCVALEATGHNGPYIHQPYHERALSDTVNMGLSKSTRIMILLGIDSAFFLLELIVGYAVHSLALVADSFHMVWQLGCGWQLVLTLV
jgi:hypothetical protein